MEATLIHRILSQNVSTKPYFRGVYASDTIPPLKNKSAVVVNLDKSSERGSHWICMFTEDGKHLEFICSYGKSPYFYGDIFKTFLLNFSHVSWNNTCFQSLTSNVCGAYCIYFLLKRCQGHSLYCIIHELKKCKKNDFRIFQFVKKNFGVRMVFKK